MFKNILIVGLACAILLGWASIAIADQNTAFVDKLVYIADKENPEDVYLYTDNLYTEEHLKDRYDTGKRVAIADWESEKSGLYDRIRTLEDTQVDNYNCILTKKDERRD